MMLAQACEQLGIYMVHLSSGCIFNGDSPAEGGWTEYDIPNPVSYYGQTKVIAEKKLMDEDFSVLILRVRMPIDKEPNPRNLINKLASYPKVIDVVNSVTVIDDLLAASANLIAQRATGIFNITNPVPVGHREILGWYNKFVDPGHRFEMISLAELYGQGLAKAGRSNCVLSTAKLEAAGVKLPDAPEAIKRCLTEYASLLGGAGSV
jgi:dTDP-4-dehydrorhamnose reductase